MNNSYIIMIVLIQAMLQDYMNQELPDVEAGFRKVKGTRDQIANICWIIEKVTESSQKICFIDYTKVFDSVDNNKLWKILSVTLTACEMSAIVQ